MASVATRSIKCPRCSGGINKGDEIEVYYLTNGGLRKWAHRNCVAGVPFTAAKPEATSVLPQQDEPQQAGPQQAGPQTEGVEDNAKKVVEFIKGELSRIHRETLVDVGDRHAKSISALAEWMKSQNDETRAQLAAEVAEAKGKIVKTVHVVQQLDGTQVDLGDEVFHTAIWRVKKLAEARLNVLLVGPTGSGKSHLCEQLARLMGLPRFGMISCSAGMTESKLIGRAVPNIQDGTSRYQGTDFLEVYENGGVFLFDEMDALDPNMALVVNSALANSRLAVPDRSEKPYAIKHKDAIIIAAANTWGTGASRSYVGRNQLDEATLDRFRYGTVEMDYDVILEEKLCPDAELRTLLHQWRANIRKARIQRIMSSRFMRDAYKMKSLGDSLADLTTAFFSGWSEEEKAKVLGVK